MDSTSFKEMVSETANIVEQLRERITAKDYTYSDDIFANTGFGPKSPGKDGMIQLADTEAMVLGRLISYCINVGTLPEFPLDMFWWSRGRCMGLSTKRSAMGRLRLAVMVVKAHADEIVATHGIEPYLTAMEEVREITGNIIPTQEDEYLTMEEAEKYTGKDKRTILRWMEAGGIPTLDKRWGLMISKHHLKIKMALVYANKIRVATT